MANHDGLNRQARNPARLPDGSGEPASAGLFAGDDIIDPRRQVGMPRDADLRALLREVVDCGLIYWEPQTTRGAIAKADLIRANRTRCLHRKGLTVPQRIQRRRSRGWKMPPNTVYVGRPTKWGNPFAVDERGSRYAVAKFRRAIKRDLLDFQVEDIREELQGKNLACFCPLNWPCHADVLLELANSALSSGQGIS